MTDHVREIWIVAEPIPSRSSRWNGRLIGFGLHLAEQLAAEVCVFSLGGRGQDAEAALSYAGVKTVRLGHAEGVACFDVEAHLWMLRQALKEGRPLGIIATGSPLARELLARLADTESSWFVPRCTEVRRLDDRQVRVSKQAYGGQLERCAELPLDRLLLASMQMEFLTDWSALNACAVPVVPVEFPAFPRTVVAKDLLSAKEAGFSLDDAEIVVAVGGGAGDREGFEWVEALARATGGVLAGSQAAVEKGWIPRSFQIGRSGRTVSPGLFWACGISGSMHFTRGMDRSGTIVAINKDPAAPIFRIADVRVVGDLRLVIPAIIREIERGEGPKCCCSQ
jgi:electron transfer flavoprotein alpha subunit